MARKNRCMFENSAFNINFDIERYSKNKESIANNIGYNMINKMQSAFKWNGLPESIPQEWLEVMLMVNGFAFVTKVNDNLYAFYGGLGGEPDPYYQPTICVVANPALKFNKECKIGEDGVLISNDTMRRGVIPVIGKYAGLLTENTITMRIADIMARLTNIMSGSDDETIESAKEYLRQVEEGNLGIIEEQPFLEDLKIQTAATTGNTRMTDLIEVDNYLKASLYSELGLRMNDNMKRESISKAEGDLGDDVIQPLIDNMLECRQKACNKINEMFGTNITVELSGPWKRNEDERDIIIEQMESEVENNGNTDSTDNSTGIPDSGYNDKPENEENSEVDSGYGRGNDETV